MNEARKLTETEQHYVDNVFQAMQTLPHENMNKLLIEFADYLINDHGKIKVVYPDGRERSSMMLSSRYLKHEPEMYLNALKIDYISAFDEEGAFNARDCLRYALRLIPKKYPDVLTMEQDSLLRQELMNNIEALDKELEAFDAFKEFTLSQSKEERTSSNNVEQSHTEPVSIMKRWFRFMFT